MPPLILCFSLIVQQKHQFNNISLCVCQGESERDQHLNQRTQFIALLNITSFKLLRDEERGEAKKRLPLSPPGDPQWGIRSRLPLFRGLVQDLNRNYSTVVCVNNTPVGLWDFSVSKIMIPHQYNRKSIFPVSSVSMENLDCMQGEVLFLFLIEGRK